MTNSKKNILLSRSNTPQRNSVAQNSQEYNKLVNKNLKPVDADKINRSYNNEPIYFNKQTIDSSDVTDSDDSS